jgi:hypothetical protein
LPPGTGHPRDVGAPEHPIRTERVEAAVQVLMEAAERIGVFRVAGLTGRLDLVAPANSLFYQSNLSTRPIRSIRAARQCTNECRRSVCVSASKRALFPTQKVCMTFATRV